MGLYIEPAMYLGHLVLTYTFWQPRRLESGLPFRLLIAKRMKPDGITELQVSEDRQQESWFLGYRWSVIVCLQCNEEESNSEEASSHHLGWKFTKSPGDFFYALIVRPTDEAQLSTRVRPGTEQINFGVPALWAAAALHDEHSGINATLPGSPRIS